MDHVFRRGAILELSSEDRTNHGLTYDVIIKILTSKNLVFENNHVIISANRRMNFIISTSALRGLQTLRVRRFTQWALGDIRETVRRFLVSY